MIVKYLYFIPLAISWLVSLFASKSTFGTLKDFSLHEWLSYHTLISMRAFEQWGFWKLLGVSVVASKSYEWQEYDIRDLWKGDGLYLSYPSLWLDIPYFIFKFLGWEISINNLHIYALIVNRFLCSIIIFFLYKELSKLLVNKLDTQENYDQTITISALIGTIAWLLTPAVLYWTQNVYFTDQAVILPLNCIFLLTLKSEFKLHDLTKWQKILLFCLTLLATGYDWYAWTFLAFMMLIYFLLNIEVSTVIKINSLVPILGGCLLVIVVYTCQILCFDDGLPQLIRTVLERAFTNQSSAKLDGFWARLIGDIAEYLYGLVFLIPISLTGLYLVRKINWNSKLLASLFLLCVAPLIHNLILANHSYIHNFTAFKFSVGIFFVFLVTPCLAISMYLPKTKYYFFAFGFIGLLASGIFFSSHRILSFSQYSTISTNFSEQLGNLIREELAQDQVPFSRTLYIPAFPPNGLWYANRRVYDLKFAKDIIQMFDLESRPVEYIFLDRDSPEAITEVCDLNQETKHRSFAVTLASGETVTEQIIICKIAEQNIVKNQRVSSY